jgi:diacylglycerol kinase family enzyme
MYYYIFEPPQGPKEYERTAQIKELLSQLGIAGEMAAPQPGRTVEDLVKIALAKRYSTIVAVGGMEIINRVARAMLSHDAVLGIIPVHNDPDVAELIGTGDWKIAAEQLKRRRWQHLQMGMMNTNICFLTPATITVPSSKELHVVSESFKLTATGPAVVRITPLRDPESPVSGLLLDIVSEAKPKSGLLSFFGTKEESPRSSHFRVQELSLTTSESYPVVVAGETLASTPITSTTEAKGIRLIVGRGTQTQ